MNYEEELWVKSKARWIDFEVFLMRKDFMYEAIINGEDCEHERTRNKNGKPRRGTKCSTCVAEYHQVVEIAISYVDQYSPAWDYLASINMPVIGEYEKIKEEIVSRNS